MSAIGRSNISTHSYALQSTHSIPIWIISVYARCVPWWLVANELAGQSSGPDAEKHPAKAKSHLCVHTKTCMPRTTRFLFAHKSASHACLPDKRASRAYWKFTPNNLHESMHVTALLTSSSSFWCLSYASSSSCKATICSSRSFSRYICVTWKNIHRNAYSQTRAYFIW